MVGVSHICEQLTHELSECMLSLLWFSRQPSEHECEQDEAPASTHLPQWFSGAWPAPALAAQRPGERAQGCFLPGNASTWASADERIVGQGKAMGGMCEAEGDRGE